MGVCTIGITRYVGKYVAYDYEVPGENNFWNIFTTDYEPEDLVSFDGAVIMTIIGPDTEEMEKAVAAICQAMDAAIDLAVKVREPKD